MDLQEILGPVAGLPYAIDDYNQGSAKTDLANYKGLQDLMFNEQNNPLKLQQQGLQNLEAQARIPGVAAQSSLRGDIAKLSSSTFMDQLDAEQRKHVLSAKEDDLKAMDLMAQQMMYNPDPSVREQGKQLYMMKGSIVAEQAKQRAMLDRQAELERIRQAGQDRRAAALQSAKARITASKGNKPSKNPFEEFSKAKEAWMAAPEGSPDKEAWAEEMQAAYNNWVWAQSNKPVAPGSVSPAGVSGLPENKPAPAPGSGLKTQLPDPLGIR